MSTDSTIAPTVATIVRRFAIASTTRDGALAEGRQLTRLAANSIRATHRGHLADAERLFAEAEQRLATLTATLRPYPSLYWAGYVQDAMKEVAEAAITLAIVTDRPVPSPIDLGVEDAAYLNGLAEAASELRRDVLDALRAGDLPRAERLLMVMDDVYSALVTVDLPDAMTGGLRRTTDALRAVLERTRGDLTLAAVQGRVEVALRQLLSDPSRAAAGADDQVPAGRSAGNVTGVPAPKP